jgi:hypothetical protein
MSAADGLPDTAVIAPALGLPPTAVIGPRSPLSTAGPTMSEPSTLKVSPLALLGLDDLSFDTGIPVSGALNDKLIRAGRGAEDIWQGAKQALLNLSDKASGGHEASDYTAAHNAELAQYEKDRAAEGNTGIDWARGLGTALTPVSAIPGAGTTKLATAGLGALAGGTAGALRYDPGNTLLDRAWNTATGAGAGAVIAPVVQGGVELAIKGAQALGTGARNAASRLADALDYGPGPAAQVAQQAAGPAWAAIDDTARQSLTDDVRKTMSMGQPVDPTMISRKANLIANGVTPTTSMVTRSASDWTIERNLQKLPGISDQLTSLYNKNDEALSGQMTGMLEGLPKASQETHGKALMQGIEDLQSAKQVEVRAAYKAQRDTVGEDTGFQPEATTEVLGNMQNNAYMGPAVQSIRSEMKSMGVLDDDGNLVKTASISQAEELRKFVNALPDYANGVNVKGFKGQVVRAIDQDVFGTHGDDPFAGARTLANQRFTILGNPSVQKGLDAFGELSEGKTAQNFIQQQVVSGSTQDVKALVESLAAIPDAAKRQTAMDALEAGTLQHFQNKAINPDTGQFSGRNLAQSIRQFGGGSDEKLVSIFGQERADQLKSLALAGVDATYSPAYSSVNNSNTAPTGLSYILGLRKVPIIGKLSEHVITPEAEKSVAERGYANQLADALKASATSAPEAQLLARQRIARALTGGPRSGALASYLFNQPRQNSGQPPNQ